MSMSSDSISCLAMIKCHKWMSADVQDCVCWVEMCDNDLAFAKEGEARRLSCTTIYSMTLTTTAGCLTVAAGMPIRNVTAMTASRALMQATWRRRKWSIGTRIETGSGCIRLDSGYHSISLAVARLAMEMLEL